MKKSIFLLLILGIGSIAYTLERRDPTQYWSIDRSKLRAKPQIAETTPSRYTLMRQKIQERVSKGIADARRIAAQQIEALKEQVREGRMSAASFLKHRAAIIEAQAQKGVPIQQQGRLAQRLPFRPPRPAEEVSAYEPVISPISYEELRAEREKAYQEAYEKGELRAGFIPQARWRLGQMGVGFKNQFNKVVQNARYYGGLTVENARWLFNTGRARWNDLSDATKNKLNIWFTSFNERRPTTESLKAHARAGKEAFSAVVNDIGEYVPSMPSTPAVFTREYWSPVQTEME